MSVARFAYKMIIPVRTAPKTQTGRSLAGSLGLHHGLPRLYPLGKHHRHQQLARLLRRSAGDITRAGAGSHDAGIAMPAPPVLARTWPWPVLRGLCSRLGEAAPLSNHYRGQGSPFPRSALLTRCCVHKLGTMPTQLWTGQYTLYLPVLSWPRWRPHHICT